jgi:hypothetical protein
MFVYLTGPKVSQDPQHTLRVCPARHLKEMGLLADAASEWFEPDGETPKEIALIFEYGRTQVDENLGRYLVKYEIASKQRASKIIRPHASEVY